MHSEKGESSPAMCSIAELNGDESLQGVCWTLAFDPLLLFIFVSHFLRHPFLPLFPSHSCLLPHFFSPHPQSLFRFCVPLLSYLLSTRSLSHLKVGEIHRPDPSEAPQGC